MKPALHVVAPMPAPATRAASPETRLKRLFAREARIEGELLDTRRELAAARAHYGRKHGLLILPSFDTLRRLFS